MLPIRLRTSLFCLPLIGCLQVTTGTGAGPGATAGSSVGPGAASSSDGGTGGTNCQEDPQSGVILCEQIDACPGVDVDPGSFPGCGFELHAGAVLDLECLCADALCPIGVPPTCAQATQLLASQNALTVCQQASEGRCIQLGVPDAGASNGCDKQCESDCSGEPGCIRLCGC